MEKKNITILTPTIEQLHEMNTILNRFHENEALFRYCFSKMVEHTIANGGLEKCSLSEYPEEIAYLISRSVALIYPETELEHISLSDVNTQDIYNELFRREHKISSRGKLDNLIHMRDDLKKDSTFLEKIVNEVYLELYSIDERRSTVPNNVRYRFDGVHDSAVKALFEGEIFSFCNGYLPEEAINKCAMIEPLYVLKCRAEDLACRSHRDNKSLVDTAQTVCLRNSMNYYGNLYSILDPYLYGMHNILSSTELFDKSNVYCKSMVDFFDKHGGKK